MFDRWNCFVLRHSLAPLAGLALASGAPACTLSDAAPDPDEVGQSGGHEELGDTEHTARVAESDGAPDLASTTGADLNGDGRADVCGRGIAGLWCALSTGTSFGAQTLWSPQFNDAEGWGAGPQYYATMRYPDIDGDGLADVCGRGIAGIGCALSNGASFDPAALWSAGFNDAGGWNQEKYYATIRFPDVNGDGRADVCGRGAAGISCALSTGNGFTEPFLWSPQFDDASGWSSVQYYSTIRFPDVDGDGRADVCGRGIAGVSCAVSTGVSFAPATLWTAEFSDGNGWASPQYYTTLQFPDINGDGRADVCARGGAGIRCGISTATRFRAPTLWNATFNDAAGWNQVQYYSTIQFPDVNGEGRADVCGRGSAGVECALSTGTSFSPSPATLWTSEYSDPLGWGASPAYYGTLRFPDLDGDGAADVCGRGGAGVACALSNTASFAPNPSRVWAPIYSDAGGWNADPRYYATIQFP